MSKPKVRRLKDFGIVTDVDTENMDKWEIGDIHNVAGVVMLSGEYGAYPAFETDKGEMFVVGGQVITRTAEELKNVFSQFKGISFNLELQEKESKKTGRVYNILVEADQPKEPKKA